MTCSVKFEIFTAVTMKNGVLWNDAVPMLQELGFRRNVSPPSSRWKNQRARNNWICYLLQVMRSSQRSVLTTATCWHIPEEDILQTMFWFVPNSFLSIQYSSFPGYLRIIESVNYSPLLIIRSPEHSNVWRMASSWMLRCVALTRTGVSDELSASFIRVIRIDELGTTLARTRASVVSYS
jgi:hypothetical protein